MKTKIVQTLPSNLESKTLYAVQVVNGFDLYLTDDNGKAKKMEINVDMEDPNLYKDVISDERINGLVLGKLKLPKRTLEVEEGVEALNKGSIEDPNLKFDKLILPSTLKHIDRETFEGRGISEVECKFTSVPSTDYDGREIFKDNKLTQPIPELEGLSSPYMYENNKITELTNINNLTIGKYKDNPITSLSFDDSVTEIPIETFRGNKLKSLNLYKKNITSIDSYGLYSDTLTSVTLNNKIKLLDYNWINPQVTTQILGPSDLTKKIILTYNWNMFKVGGVYDFRGVDFNYSIISLDLPNSGRCKVKAGTYDLDLKDGGLIEITPRQNDYEIFDYEVSLDGSVNYEGGNMYPFPKYDSTSPLPEDSKYIKLRNSRSNIFVIIEKFTLNKLDVRVLEDTTFLIKDCIINYNENMNFYKITVKNSKINFDSYVEPTEVLNKDGNTIVVPTDLVERFRTTWTNVTIETK